MNETLFSLEQKRDNLYQQLQETGDFRRGAISVNYRKCGKKNCACAMEGHQGHGPQYLWNGTIKGKSYAKSVKLGPELEEYLKDMRRLFWQQARFDPFVKSQLSQSCITA